MKELVTLEELNKELELNTKTIIKLGSDCCGPCRAVENTMLELEEEGLSDVNFCKVDVEESDEITDYFDILSIPTLLFYRGNELVKTTGFLTKTQLKDEISEL